MATYSKVFNNPYPNGWKDSPSESTPITANALQQHTNAIEHLEQYLVDNPGGGGGSANDVELTKAEYDALPSTKESDNVNYYITDWVEDGGTSGSYSTTKVPIGTWIDGRTIYRRVFRFSTITITNNAWFKTNIKTTDNIINEVLNCYGGLYSANGKIEFCYGLLCSISINAGYVSLLSDRTNSTVSCDYIILEYLE